MNQQASAEGTCISSRVDRSRRGDAVAWDFSTEPEFQKKLDWVEEFCREEVEPLDYVFPYAVRSPDPKVRALSRPPGAGQGPGPVGDLPRRGARRPGLRPAQARPAQRDPRPLPVGAADVRRRRARHRQHGDARRLRHRGAEGALARAAAQPGDVLGVLDDRAAGRLRPEPVQDPRRARRRRVGHQRREVVHQRRPGRRHPLRHVHQRHVRRAAQDARASRSMPEPRNHNHIIYNDVRVPARPPARPRGRRQGARPAAPRRRPHPPRDAHHRPVQAGLRHDVRAGAQPRVARQDHRRAPDGAGEDRRLLRPDPDAAPVRARDGVEDRQHHAPRRRAPTSPR